MEFMEKGLDFMKTTNSGMKTSPSKQKIINAIPLTTLKKVNTKKNLNGNQNNNKIFAKMII